LFRAAARSLALAQQIWIEAFYWRLTAVKGGKVANQAAARKVAELFYYGLTKGMAYVEQGNHGGAVGSGRQRSAERASGPAWRGSAMALRELNAKQTAALQVCHSGQALLWNGAMLPPVAS
jgi:hypothetical protein